MASNGSPLSIRNVALLGHQGNGKTTLAEAMLFRSGVIPRAGRVDTGSTVLGSQPEERDRNQSLTLGVVSFRWNDCQINLIDTPGYADFTGDALAALRIADVAVFVVDGVAGLEVNDELLWEAAAQRSIPRMIFINKMDKEHASFDATLDGIRERFGTGVEPVELPVGAASAFSGVADLLTEHVFLYDTGTGTAVESEDLPASIADREHTEHEHLVEDVVELEDDLMSRYLDGEEIGVAELEHALKTGFSSGTLWPVLCGSATEAIAVDRLLEFICHVAPAPTELPPMRLTDDTEVKCHPDGEPLAYVFKTQTDEYVGQVALLKVLSGTLHADDQLVNSRTGTRERMHNLLRVFGSKTSPIDTAVAGDIIGAIKLSDVATGDTLAPSGSTLVVPPVEIQQPVYGVAVAAQSTQDEDKLSTALAELVRDDPSLRVIRDPETHQRVLEGAGDVQIQVALARIKRRFGIEVGTEPVKVAFRETLVAPVQTEGRHKKQSGGHGQFGVATVRFEPLPRDSGFEFADETRGGVIPKSLVPAVGKGIAESMVRGGTHGFPLVDIRATVVDGKHHSVDSDEHSFKMAGALALREAIDKVGTAVLEPVMHVEVTVPTELQGDVLADLARRRGQIEGTDVSGTENAVVSASVPHSDMIDYAIALRSMTHGRGRFTMRFKAYQERP